MSEGIQAEGTVLGIDNVPIELPVAGAPSRSLAAFLDYLIVGVLSILWLVAGARWVRLFAPAAGSSPS